MQFAGVFGDAEVDPRSPDLRIFLLDAGCSAFVDSQNFVACQYGPVARFGLSLSDMGHKTTVQTSRRK